MNPPKPNQSSFFSQLLFVLSLLILLAVVGGYFGLYYLNTQSQNEYDDLNNQLAQKETPAQKDMETSVLGYKQKLQDFSKILNAHTAPSGFFASLEKLTYPDAYFDNLMLSPLDKTAVLTGKIDSFKSLAKQILIFKNAKDVFSSVNLSKISIGSDGKVVFSIDAKIQPDVILYK